MSRKSAARLERDQVKRNDTPEKIAEQKARLQKIFLGRIDRAGGLLAEVDDHLKRGEVNLAAIGALAEVQKEVAEALSLVAFYLRAGEVVAPPTELLVPDVQLQTPTLQV